MIAKSRVFLPEVFRILENCHTSGDVVLRVCNNLSVVIPIIVPTLDSSF